VHPTFSSQPPDVVQSDSQGNTAMGRLVLSSLQPGAAANTAVGFAAMLSNLTGSYNTAVGSSSMWLTRTSSFDIEIGAALSIVSCAVNDANSGCNIGGGGGDQYTFAVGSGSLFKNQGEFNVGIGYQALTQSQSPDNTALGVSALQTDTVGSGNTATGVRALFLNTSGTDNVASGRDALRSNTTGNFNTVEGQRAMFRSTTGNQNTIVGSESMYENDSGSGDTAVASRALYSNVDGMNNVGVGKNALASNSSGGQNVAFGYSAGSLATGSSNIAVGNQGAAGESGAIRIGTAGIHGTTFIAGISGTPLSAGALVVSATGQLGVTPSSERFKTAIVSMDDDHAKLSKLKPVRYRLKGDPSGTVQYGLIAEQVAEVYPELVIRDPAGRIDGVRYDELAPLILNVLQKEQQLLTEQEVTMNAQGAQLREQEMQLTAYADRLEALKEEMKMAREGQ
jgi:hypothetical protein